MVVALSVASGLVIIAAVMASIAVASSRAVSKRVEAAIARAAQQ